MAERMNEKDKKDLKALYAGLKELTEDEYSLLWEKYYLSTGTRAFSDKVMAEKYGMEQRDYYKKRHEIESKLQEHVLVIEGPITTGKTIAEIINEVIEENKQNYGESFNSIELK